MEKPVDPIDKILFDIVAGNSPIQNKKILEKAKKEGIGNRRAQRHLKGLIDRKFFKKKNRGHVTLYFIEREIKLRSTVYFIVDSLILLEKKIPDTARLISKKMKPEEFRQLSDTFTKIDRSKKALEKMLIWELPSDEDIYVVDEDSKIIDKHKEKFFPPKISTIKNVIRNLGKEEKLLVEKLRRANHDMYSFVHNSEFNKLG